MPAALESAESWMVVFQAMRSCAVHTPRTAVSRLSSALAWLASAVTGRGSPMPSSESVVYSVASG